MVDEVLRERWTHGLNQGQADAFMMFVDFVNSEGDDMLKLKGFAGTGKSFLVRHLVQWLKSNKSSAKIAITAPTNKAVRVLYEARKFSDGVTYQTIHSLLGLTENISNDGKVTFSSKGNGTISKIKYLIVDETSMLHDEVYHLLKPHSSNVKILFIGDPAQIPPVGQTDSIPFKECISEKYEEGYTLTEIMRQERGNPIIEASMRIRDNLQNPVPIPILSTQRDDKGHGLIWIDPETGRDELMHQLETHFTSKNFRDDSDYAKIIAWRNKTVFTANSAVRKMIYGDHAAKIEDREMLLANKPIFDADGGIMFNTSDELQVIGDPIIETRTVKFGGKSVEVKVYKCKVLTTSVIKPNETINILHESSELDYFNFTEQLKERAKNMRSSKLNPWIDYYDAIKWPADVGYNYAITAHKAQGSTYKNVFLMEEDLDANKNIVERNRIKYTSYTRASHNLYVYRRNK